MRSIVHCGCGWAPIRAQLRAEKCQEQKDLTDAVHEHDPCYAHDERKAAVRHRSPTPSTSSLDGARTGSPSNSARKSSRSYLLESNGDAAWSRTRLSHKTKSPRRQAWR